jgi:hypothetical protein
VGCPWSLGYWQGYWPSYVSVGEFISDMAGCSESLSKYPIHLNLNGNMSMSHSLYLLARLHGAGIKLPDKTDLSFLLIVLISFPAQSEKNFLDYRLQV